ncbi:hypothetical protein ONZ51_g1863 [Trametes cubensis]|uniref:EF-hand domain-containing protein n=1 Tax=Trametes cubensis TaxID=1111947 RepID=A0AAD7U1R2_9APHY|nr:hypothetical protein ONZ51_g1863 [Trametes cubensis]
MSLASFAKRFRRSRTKSSDVPSSSKDSSLNGAKAEDRSRLQVSEVKVPDDFPSQHASNVPTQGAMRMPQPNVAMPHGHANAMDGALADLRSMHEQLEAGPPMPSSNRAIDTLGGKVDVLVDQANKAMSVINSDIAPVVAALDKTDIVQKIERGIRHFTDDIPWLMKGLDELARIHPAVTVAVLAFKAVYALETTRQENDRRVITLYVEMKDMMMVMVQLKGVEGHNHVGLDGRVLKDRLEDLAEKTAKDIKDCANLCDTFLKKRLIVKVLKGPIWADKLAGFVQTFADRKADFQFALTMHSANTMSDVKKQNYEIDAKIDVVISLFDRFVTSEERRLAEEVENKGGALKVRQNDEYLKSLMALDISMRRGPVSGAAPGRDQLASRKRESAVPVSREGRAGALRESAARARDGAKEASITLEDLKWELREDIDEALDRNLETFLGKFELQVSMLQAALERYIRDENDRIIGAVKDVVLQGPHLKVRDPELRKVWQDMNWRSNVKARLLVMTLRDYYRDVIEEARHAPGDQQILNDEWTLAFLGPTWFQPLFEAFDDDASGYITIAEINKFMEQRPAALNWSAPRWFAFWAVGWSTGAAMYVTRIKELLSSIRAALQYVLPLNRKAADQYLKTTWVRTLKLTQKVSTHSDWAMEDNFRDYYEYEEQRLRSNLERIKYHIDASDTVSLVLGSDRLEATLLPVLWLLLENDYRKFRAARHVILADSELENSSTTIDQISYAADPYSELFDNQKIDCDSKFETYARGLFYYEHFERKFWDEFQNDLTPPRLAAVYDDETVDLSKITQDTDVTSGMEIYDLVDDETEDDLTAPLPVKSILGLWHGFVYDQETYPSRSMLSLRFHYSDKEGEDFRASGIEFDGDPYKISGKCTVDNDGTILAEFVLAYSGNLVIHYHGRLVDEYTIEGNRGYSTDEEDQGEFILKRIPAEYMVLRPSPLRLRDGNRRLEMWQYAISAALSDVRRRNWSWSYFAERRDARKLFIKVMSRSFMMSNPDFREKLARIRQVCNAQDARFYYTLYERHDRIVPYHSNRFCESPECRDVINGACVMCIDCAPVSDCPVARYCFCDKPECYNYTHDEAIYGLEAYHNGSHDFVKVRTILHDPDIMHLIYQATDILRWMRRRTDTPPPDPPGTTTDDGDPEIVESIDTTADTASHADTSDESCHQSDDQHEDHSAPARYTMDVISVSSNQSQLELCVEATSPSSEAPPQPEDSSLPAAGLSIDDSGTSDGCKEDPIVSPADVPLPRMNGSVGTASLDGRDVGQENTKSTRSESTHSQDTHLEGAHSESTQDIADAEPPGADTEVTSQVASSAQTGDDHDGSSVAQNPACKICLEPVYMGQCWLCIQCWAYICNDCESRQLITCGVCTKPFPQPEWYWGSRADDFICNRCAFHGLREKADPNFDHERCHVGTHDLVVCKRAPQGPPDPPRVPYFTTEQRLASLEARVTAMDTRLEQLQTCLVQLAQTQTDMQRTIVAKLDEALVSVSGRLSNGHAGP